MQKNPHIRNGKISSHSFSSILKILKNMKKGEAGITCPASKKKMRKPLVLFVGRTAAGKSALAHAIAKKYGLSVVKSYATRPPRKQELEAGLENADHVFISETEYVKLKDIVADTEINGYHYCTTKEQLEKNDIYVIDPNGIDALQRSEFARQHHLVIFYIYANEDIRNHRFKLRGETASVFQARNQSEDAQFNAFEEAHTYDIIIYNNTTMEDAMSVLWSYLKLVIEPWRQEEQEQEKVVPNSSASDKADEAASTTDLQEATTNATAPDVKAEADVPDVLRIDEEPNDSEPDCLQDSLLSEGCSTEDETENETDDNTKESEDEFDNKPEDKIGSEEEQEPNPDEKEPVWEEEDDTEAILVV